MLRTSKPIAERFWPKVEKTEGCWLWRASRNRAGYGYFGDWSHRRTRAAHRVSWELAHGPIPPGLLVCHTCDNPPCVRPDHLFLGTHTDNLHDSMAKGRKYGPAHTARLPRGTQHYKARFTDEDIRAIRDAYGRPGVTFERLARQYGVTGTTIHYIIKRHTWKHVA